MPLAQTGGFLGGLQSGMSMAMDLASLKQRQDQMRYQQEQDAISLSRQRMSDLTSAVSGMRQHMSQNLTPETRDGVLDDLGFLSEYFGEDWPEDLRPEAWAPAVATPNRFGFQTAMPTPGSPDWKLQGYGSPELKSRTIATRAAGQQAEAFAGSPQASQEARTLIFNGQGGAMGALQRMGQVRSKYTDQFGAENAQNLLAGMSQEIMAMADTEAAQARARIDGAKNKIEADEMLREETLKQQKFGVQMLNNYFSAGNPGLITIGPDGEPTVNLGALDPQTRAKYGTALRDVSALIDQGALASEAIRQVQAAMPGILPVEIVPTEDRYTGPGVPTWFKDAQNAYETNGGKVTWNDKTGEAYVTASDGTFRIDPADFAKGPVDKPTPTVDDLTDSQPRLPSSAEVAPRPSTPRVTPAPTPQDSTSGRGLFSQYGDAINAAGRGLGSLFSDVRGGAGFMWSKLPPVVAANAILNPGAGMARTLGLPPRDQGTIVSQPDTTGMANPTAYDIWMMSRKMAGGA